MPELKDIDDVPQSVREDYRSAINVYNIQEWNATAVCCRRVIEGLMRSLLSEEYHDKTLYEQLRALPDSRDLGEPIVKLADAIRQGGNWGAHARGHDTPDEETAMVMLEFIEYLLEYLYSLPHRVAQLSQRIMESKTS